MNKNILCFGNRNKADYLLLFSHVISSLDKRVLIVDFTQNEVYRHGYTRLKENEFLFDYQGVDILTGASNIEEAVQILAKSSESLSQYDLIFYDVDNEAALQMEWPQLSEVVYMGDFDRINLIYDAKMIDAFVDKYPEEKLRRITFGTKYKINENTLETFLTNEVKWNSVHILFEADETIDEIKLEMQHQLTMPFKHINANHKEHIIGMVSEFYQLHVADIKVALKGKTGLFGKLFNKRSKNKEEQAFAQSNEKNLSSEIVLLKK